MVCIKYMCYISCLSLLLFFSGDLLIRIYTGIEHNDRYAKNMKHHSQNVALGTKQGRSLQMTILEKLVEFFTGSLSYLI